MTQSDNNIMKYILLNCIALLIFISTTNAQHKVEPTIPTVKKTTTKRHLEINPTIRNIDFKPSTHQTPTKETSTFRKQINLDKRKKSSNLEIDRESKTSRVLSIKGTTSIKKNTKDSKERALQHLDNLSEVLEIKTPSQELTVIATTEGIKGDIHHKFQQYHKGIKVLDAQINTQEKDGQVYFVSGNWDKTPGDLKTEASIESKAAIQHVIDDLDHFQPIPEKLQRFVNHNQIQSELVIANVDGDQQLVWFVDIYESLSEHWEYMVDAHSGKILKKRSVVCKIDGHNHGGTDPKSNLSEVKPLSSSAIMDGKTTSVGRDLFNQQRSLNVYECKGAFFLADAGRTMFHGNESDCLNDDLLLHGMIITYDALGTTPAVPRSFNYNFGLTTQQDVWNDPRAISAHYNGGQAYEYFKNTFGRESINGDRGNIESFFNVADEDGQDMDNAFWTGAAIFYGNGRQAFRGPLAAAIDVAGHEMSHGVVQTTANLRYEGESGALNESFADVFGAMIERETWEIGEDIVNQQIFRTGALRNMADPNNGGTSLNDPGYQPANTREQFFGSEDNGGVHINSGIPSLAYVLFASDESVGIQIAEQVYYKVLTQFLTPRSQFVDLRAAVIQVAGNDYGQSVAAAAERAFDGVGITGQGLTRTEIPNREIETNPGTLDLIMWSSENLQSINFSTNTGNFSGITINRPHISKPSISDNGQFIVFANTNRQAVLIEMDWTTGNIVNEVILFDGVRNVVISKDGTKLAAVTGDLSTGDFDNLMFIIDLISNEQQVYELNNPTFTENISTGEVLFADVMEFDLIGENVVYDSFNFIEGTNGLDLSYWDIGIIKVWENNTGNFEPEGNNIFKVFSGLPENVSVGNPTYSKNNPDVIAFDLREIGVINQDTVFQILGANLITGDVEEIFENNTWGYPNYSIDDSELIFSFDDRPLILGRTPLGSDRISSSGDAVRFIQDDVPQWGVWFGTGNRDLLSDTEDPVFGELVLYPNPVADYIQIDLPQELEGDKRIEIFTYEGKRVLTETFRSFDNSGTIDVSELPNGSFLLKLSTKDALFTEKIVILK
jgi:Zn-dependent metalloprotease